MRIYILNLLSCNRHGDYNINWLYRNVSVTFYTTNLVIAGLKLLLPVVGVPLHRLHPLRQLLDLSPEVSERSALGGVGSGGGTGHVALIQDTGIL